MNKLSIETKNVVNSNYGGLGGNFWTGDLRRIAVFVDDGNIKTEITVGSLQAVKTNDPSVWNVDINGVLGMTPETVPENLKKQLDQYNIII